MRPPHTYTQLRSKSLTEYNNKPIFFISFSLLCNVLLLRLWLLHYSRSAEEINTQTPRLKLFTNYAQNAVCAAVQYNGAV